MFVELRFSFELRILEGRFHLGKSEDALLSAAPSRPELENAGRGPCGRKGAWSNPDWPSLEKYPALLPLDPVIQETVANILGPK